MSWKECHVMDERLRFVARLLEGEKMAPLCAAFGISRKTGYKIFERYKDCGIAAFTDRSRRPYRQANRLPAPIEATIVRLKREYPGWGAPKIREKLRQQVPGVQLPAISTVHAVLDRHGLVKRRRRRRPAAAGTALSRPTEPNALWCADYKGEFPLGNRQYCYPLTITDFASRYLLTCEALSTTQEQFAFTFFECDNQERPHQALGMQVPAVVYTRSPRVYRGLAELTYPYHDATITVTQCGRLCFQGRKVNLSQVFAGQNVGVTQVGEHVWLVTFMQYDLGYFDDQTCRLEPIDYPFGSRVLPMCSE